MFLRPALAGAPNRIERNARANATAEQQSVLKPMDDRGRVGSAVKGELTAKDRREGEGESGDRPPRLAIGDSVLLLDGYASR